ncbi:hypothetical protein NFI96_022324, partial [Prochilodus magdalenae]
EVTVLSTKKLFLKGLFFQVDCSAECAKKFLDQILDSSALVTPENVMEYLNVLINCTEAFRGYTADENELKKYGNSVLKATKTLLAGLVINTDTYYSINISLKTLEVQLVMVGPNASLTNTIRLSTSKANLDIDLIGISKNNGGFAAVALISYTNMANFLTPDVFGIMASDVVSVTLLNTSNQELSKPFNISQIQSRDIIEAEGYPFCSNWKNNDWEYDDCEDIEMDTDHTVCSCQSLGTVSLITEDDTVYFVTMPLGLVFLSSTLLIFVLCRRQLTGSNMTLINLCTSLLLTQVLVVIKEALDPFLNGKACAVLAGFLQFFFLTSFVWMLIDAVMLFNSAKNLTKIRSNNREALNWKYLILIGYGTGLIVVGVSAAVVSDAYDERCWLDMNKSVRWSFYGPVYFILALNMILFIAICIIISFTLKNMNSEILQRTRTEAEKKLIISILVKTVAQFFILGCPWVVGFIIDKNLEYFSVVILICVQSVFIFLVHCVFNQEVREQCIKKLRPFCQCKKLTKVGDTQVTEGEAPNPASN